MSNTMELQLNLKVQEKMLNKQADRELRNADKERNKAKAALRKGDRMTAQLHAQNSIRCQNMSLQLQQSAAKISSMVVDLKMAEVQAKMAKNLNVAVKELQKSVGQMDLQKIAAATLKYDQIRGKVSEAGAIINQPEASLDVEGEDLLGDLENEIMIEMDAVMPDIPTSEPQQQIHDKQGPTAA